MRPPALSTEEKKCAKKSATERMCNPVKVNEKSLCTISVPHTPSHRDVHVEYVIHKNLKFIE